MVVGVTWTGLSVSEPVALLEISHTTVCSIKNMQWAALWGKKQKHFVNERAQKISKEFLNIKSLAWTNFLLYFIAY